MVQNAQRKVWDTPRVRRFGTFVEATQQCTDKDLGSSDGITFQGQPIGCSD